MTTRLDDGEEYHELAPDDPLAVILRPTSDHLGAPPGRYEAIRRAATRRRLLRAAAGVGASCALAALLALPLTAHRPHPSTVPLAPPPATGPTTPAAASATPTPSASPTPTAPPRTAGPRATRSSGNGSPTITPGNSVTPTSVPTPGPSATPAPARTGPSGSPSASVSTSGAGTTRP
ncbi:hypothetical protein ACWGLF_28860 [Streptomyces puniciscabiei]